MSEPRPYNLIAELTYRCPLRCVYCSNPLGYRAVRDALDGAAWSRVFGEAAGLGAVHVGLTGGEPTLHPDLEEIVAGAARASLYSHLVTAGTTLDRDGLAALARAGLRSVQLSIQDADAAASDEVAGAECFAAKLAFADSVRELGIPLTINVVLHRHNLARVAEITALAQRLGAARLELANAQYQGWALRNRAALLPTRAQLDAAAQEVARLRRETRGMEILFVRADYYGDRPRALHGRLGATEHRRGARRAGPAVPRRRRAARARVLARARARAVRLLARRAGHERVPRRGMDAGAVPRLPRARARLRRLPLPGVCARRR